MIGAGAACFGGAIVSRKRIAIASAAIMLFAMIDLAVIGAVPALVWSAALLGAGLLLGFGLRLELRSCVREPEETRGGGQRYRAAMVASALAYPMMAWLTLGHVGSAGASVGVHAGHSAAPLVLVMPLVLAWVLTVVLIMLCVGSVRQRMVHAAIETGAMAVMIIAMLTMSH